MYKLWVTFILILAIIGVRQYYEPKEVPFTRPQFESKSVDELHRLIESHNMSLADLSVKLAASKILLFGEEHFYKEIMQSFLGILDALPDEKIVLCLELPSSMQNDIDRYMASGKPSDLDTIWKNNNGLPYQSILEWAFKNKHRVQRVIGIDEDRAWTILMRTLLRDTRNNTMAKHIMRATTIYPDVKIIAYGGQAHMLLAGRYMYDLENRTPVGKRLLQLGKGRSEVTSIMISGEGKTASTSAWDQKWGVIDLKDGFCGIQYEFFIDMTIFGEKSVCELFDFFVYAGTLSKTAKSSL